LAKSWILIGAFRTMSAHQAKHHMNELGIQPLKLSLVCRQSVDSVQTLLETTALIAETTSNLAPTLDQGPCGFSINSLP